MTARWASLGTALTPDHAQLLSRYFPQAILAYDGDGAGVAAAQRAIPLLEKAGLKVRVLRMRGAKDPDEFIKAYGRDAFQRLLDQSENQVDYRLDQIKKKYNLEDDAQKVAFLQEAAQMLSTLPSAVERRSTAATLPKLRASPQRPWRWRSRRPSSSGSGRRKRNRSGGIWLLPSTSSHRPGSCATKIFAPLWQRRGHPASVAGSRPGRGNGRTDRKGIFLSPAWPGV